MRGKIKWFNTVKHIGFLISDQENKEVFFHINDFEGRSPEVGMFVEFDLGLDAQDRVKAIRITPSEDQGDVSGKKESAPRGYVYPFPHPRYRNW